ncbi:unnamed protein product [Caenorhabditis nigoni]
MDAIEAIRRHREPVTSSYSDANFLTLGKVLRDFTECFIEPQIHGNIIGDSLDYMNEQISELGDRTLETNMVPRKEIRFALIRILETVTPKKFQEPILAESK